MELRNYIRPIIAGLIVLGLIILVIVFLVRIFSGPDTPEQASTDITSYVNTGSEATLVMQGPNVLNQNFRQVRIMVGQSQNEISLIEGYEGRVVRTQTYQSNSSAYDTFLQGLKRQGFSNGTDGDKDGYRGVCPFGSRYLYGFNDGNTDLFDYWSTSCGGQGTFQGNGTNVRRLFINQVPSSDFSSFMNGTRITY